MAQQTSEFKAKLDETHKGEENQKQPPQEAEKEKKEEKSQEEKPKTETAGLFGSLASGQNLFNNTGVNIQTGSLFGGSLFGQSQPTTGLFSSGPSLFNNSNVDLTKPGPSLFGINYSAPKSDESDGGEDDGQDEQKPEDDEPKQLVMKYDYTSNTDQIVKVAVEKFRKNANDIQEKGTVAIEKAKTAESFYFLYRNKIQQILYTGQLIKGISEVKPLGTKPENLILKAVSRNSEPDAKKEFSIDTLKVMFSAKEGADQFKEEFAKIFQ